MNRVRLDKKDVGVGKFSPTPTSFFMIISTNIIYTNIQYLLICFLKNLLSVEKNMNLSKNIDVYSKKYYNYKRQRRPVYLNRTSFIL